MRINEIVVEGKTGPGLWANIHAKRERIKSGSGERMRKPGSKGAPTAKNFKDAANEGVAEGSSTDFAGRLVNQELVNRQEKYWNQVAKEKKDKEKAALRAAQSDYEKTPAGKAEKYWSQKGVAEGKEDKIKQLKQDYATAVHWSKNDTNPHKREAARQKAEKIKAHLEKQYKQGVAEGSLNEFAPGGNDGDDRDYEYEVYQCNPKDQFDWVGGPIYKTDDMAKAHGVAYNLNKKHPNKAFMIWQERSQGSRGGYGIKDDEQGVAEDSNEVDYPVELSAEIINWIKKTYPTATVAQLRDKSWIADKVKEYHREPKVLSGVRQAAQDAGRLEESMLEETYDGDEFYEAYGDLWYDEEQLNEAEYQGRKVQLGKPVRSSNGPKKFHVFVKDPSTGNVKKVNFGDKNMRIKKSDPARRKSFRARHNCANPGPRTKAKYWSCRNW